MPPLRKSLSYGGTDGEYEEHTIIRAAHLLNAPPYLLFYSVKSMQIKKCISTQLFSARYKLARD